MVSGHGRRLQRRARRRLLADLQPGDACCRCGRPMHPDVDDLHADHFELPLLADPDAVPDALAHARCNVYAGRVLQLVVAGQATHPHPDAQLEAVRLQVLGQCAGFDLRGMAALAGRGPDIRNSREW
jgi:hypothetical protein